MTGGERRLRADAARNRERIIEAARAAFASDGIDVSMAEIARRAGVGFATAQRRFPTRDSLIGEIIAEELAQLQQTTAAPDAANDPWEAFAVAISACAAQQARHPGLAGAIADSVTDATHSDPTGQIGSMFAAIARQATDAGILRADVIVDDVLAILKGNAGVVAHSPRHEGAASARFVQLALRGLRAD